jgi:hypothetical protein
MLKLDSGKILPSLLSFIGAQASKLGTWAIYGNYMLYINTNDHELTTNYH